MKVKDLIKQLKKCPKDLEVYWKDHDQSQYEINNVVGYVEVVEKPDPEYDSEYDVRAWDKERADYCDKMDEVYCLLSP